MPILDVCCRRARVRISFVKLLLVSLAISASANGQMPAGFHWVDFKRECMQGTVECEAKDAKVTAQFVRVDLAKDLV
jgi:hypothetical protein